MMAAKAKAVATKAKTKLTKVMCCYKTIPALINCLIIYAGITIDTQLKANYYV